jgi:3-deoxy-7-phosphoheptulonate synthase
MRLVTENTRSIRAVSTPAEVQAELPVSETAAGTAFDTRREIQDILGGRDERLLVIVGPCSIHDPRRHCGLRGPAQSRAGTAA